MTETTIRVNPLPAPTWRWLRINDTEIKLPSDVTEALMEASVPEDGNPAFSEEEYRKLAEVETGMGAEFRQFTAAAPVEPFLWKTSGNEASGQPLVFRLFADGREDTVNRFYFSADQGSEVTAVVYLTGETGEDVETEERTSFAALDTRIYVHKNAKLRLVQICDTKKNTAAYMDTGAYVEEGGSLEILHIAMDGKDTFFGVAADLAGKEAHFGVETGYQAGEGQHVDLNYVARHRGVKTTTEMEIRGVLRKGASKNCRATIDFIRGCKESKGEEREDVLLLDEDVVNKTIPLILCQEEDVEGAHGATIGDLSEEMLIYFRSRGIDDETAYQLMAQGRLLGVIRQIPDETLRSELLKKIGEEE